MYREDMGPFGDEAVKGEKEIRGGKEVSSRISEQMEQHLLFLVGMPQCSPDVSAPC